MYVTYAVLGGCIIFRTRRLCYFQYQLHYFVICLLLPVYDCSSATWLSLHLPCFYSHCIFFIGFWYFLHLVISCEWYYWLLNRGWFLSQFQWNYIILCHAAVLIRVVPSTMQICQKNYWTKVLMLFGICLRWWYLLERYVRFGLAPVQY